MRWHGAWVDASGALGLGGRFDTVDAKAFEMVVGVEDAESVAGDSVEVGDDVVGMDGKDGANRFADGLGGEGREDVGGG